MKEQNIESKKQEFWDSIDLQPLNECLSKLLCTKVNLKKKQSEIRGNTYYTLKDDTNIAPLNAITNAAWQEMKVESFSSVLNVKEETGEITYWANINLTYQHWGGGQNGAAIASVSYANNSWTIRTEEECANR